MVKKRRSLRTPLTLRQVQIYRGRDIPIPIGNRYQCPRCLCLLSEYLPLRCFNCGFQKEEV